MRNPRVPLLHTCFTIADPYEQGVRATVEVIVLAPDQPDGEGLAAEDDLPILQQAGWQWTGCMTLDVYVRTVC